MSALRPTGGHYLLPAHVQLWRVHPLTVIRPIESILEVERPLLESQSRTICMHVQNFDHAHKMDKPRLQLARTNTRTHFQITAALQNKKRGTCMSMCTHALTTLGNVSSKKRVAAMAAPGTMAPTPLVMLGSQYWAYVQTQVLIIMIKYKVDHFTHSNCACTPVDLL